MMLLDSYTKSNFIIKNILKVPLYCFFPSRNGCIKKPSIDASRELVLPTALRNDLCFKDGQ